MCDKKTTMILVCVAVLGGCIATYSAGKAYDSFVELRELRADRANHVIHEQVWEVFCWDEALERHSLRYVAQNKLSYEVESGMCETLHK